MLSDLEGKNIQKRVDASELTCLWSWHVDSALSKQEFKNTQTTNVFDKKFFTIIDIDCMKLF